MADEDDIKHNNYPTNTYNEIKSCTGELDNRKNSEVTQRHDHRKIRNEEDNICPGSTNNNIGIITTFISVDKDTH